MAKKYINADKLVHVQIFDEEHEEHFVQEMTIADAIDFWTDEGCPEAADVVSREVFTQVKWERDMALQQLKELGYGLGEISRRIDSE